MFDPEGSSSDEESVFQDALTSSAPKVQSKHMELVAYAQKHPGRLASRLLQKMQEALGREEGALIQSSTSKALTPPVACSYFLTVMVPTYPQAMTMRVRRELRTGAQSSTTSLGVTQRQRQM